MKKYWLILDSYTFIWKNDVKVLVYNSLSGRGFDTCLSPVLDAVVNKILDMANMYCVEISEKERHDDGFSNFVRLLKGYFCGDIILNDNVSRPISIYPKLNINEAIDRDYKGIDNFESFGHHVAKNLLEFTLYLNGQIGKSNFQNQILWFLSGENFLSLNNLDLLFDKIQGIRILDFNVVAKNIFEYPYLERLYYLLQKHAFKVSFYTYYKSVCSRDNFIQIASNERFEPFLFLDFPIEESVIEKIHSWHVAVKYVVKISSVEEYDQVLTLIDKYQLDIKISPWFNGNNLSFFEEYVFLKKDDLLDTQWNKQEIFSHQVLNTNDFGKLSMLPNGVIYANTFFDSIGGIRDNIKQLIYKELKEGKSWRRTRDTLVPCCSCLYRYVCPSPSNYELVLEKSNMCFCVDCLD